MAERIGNVLYWLGCTAAGLIVLLAASMYVVEPNKGQAALVSGFVLIFALLAWVAGRACRYVLAGR